MKINKTLIALLMITGASAPAFATMHVTKRGCENIEYMHDHLQPGETMGSDNDEYYETCEAANHKAATSYRPGIAAPISVNKLGISFTRSRDGFAYIDGHAAAVDENTPEATTYSAGLYTVIVYKHTGKIVALKSGQLVGRLK